MCQPPGTKSVKLKLFADRGRFMRPFSAAGSVAMIVVSMQFVGLMMPLEAKLQAGAVSPDVAFRSAPTGRSAIGLRDQALQFIDNGELDKAGEIFRDLAKDGDADSLMDLAGCFYRKDAYEESINLCHQALSKPPGKHYDEAMIRLGMAECLYKSRELKEAENEFQQCLSLLTRNDSGLIAIFALEGLGGCYIAQRKYEKSVTVFEELAKLNRDLYGSEDIGYGWALLQLSESYKKSGNEPSAKALYEKAIWIFRDTNFRRLLAEHSGEDVEKKLRARVFGDGGDKDEYRYADKILAGKSKYLSVIDPAVSLPRCAWRRQFRQVEAPGWVWCDPNAPVNAILVCVHGLGLHHRSFDSFAKRVALRGIVSVSFDVRGFGTYLASKGQDTLEVQECVYDLKGVIAVLRRDYPGKPLFVLGESMGGAIALHLAAEAPELMNGVICSVPSGSRHQGASTAVNVGLHYISGKNTPMNIGDKVIRQATSKQDLRNTWSSDPSARLKLTPKELVCFQSFMDQNIAAAKKITETPVILFQGDDDKLVKKTGTYELFEALATGKKTLVLLGHTEHLIFEAGQFQDDVTLGVIDWMSFHGQSRAK